MNQIYIIYNPNSTGNSKSRAAALQKKLKQNGLTCQLLATEHAGHARQLASQYSAPGTMLISSSGDGGFNEVVSGVLSSKHPRTVVGLLPAGNANDHYAARHKPKLINRIINQEATSSDAIKVSWDDQTYFAHSYIGLGLSADIGEQLTKHKLNPFLEVWLVVRNLFRRRPVQIKIDDKTYHYDSYICSVVNRMAKFLNLPDGAKRPAGEFVITHTEAGSFTNLVKHFLSLSLAESNKITSARQISLTTLAETSLQLDGEVVDIPSGSLVKIECLPGAIKSII